MGMWSDIAPMPPADTTVPFPLPLISSLPSTSASRSPVYEPQSSDITSAPTLPPPAAPADDPAAAPKKRRSRWAQAQEDAAVAAASSAPASTDPSASSLFPSPSSASPSDAAPDQPRAKRSRWGERDASSSSQPTASSAALTAASIVAQMTQALLTPAQLEQYKLQSRIDELTRYIANPSLYLSSSPTPPRSPSPPPTYDTAGLRTNTREARLRTRFTHERNELIPQLAALNPSYRPPADWKKQTKFERRCYIPVKEHPGYNFIGLIIGPRGSTQKKMEKESGCKIVIRGRGSSKDGKAMKKQPDDSDNDDIHVLITGDSQERVDSTAAIVEKLLIPIDEALNEHKSKQLRELALINGTLRDDVVCRVCGQRGHKLFECPERVGAAWKPADVRCDWCGETTHISSDCPRRVGGHGGGVGKAEEALNAEYASFMSEITGGQMTQRGIVGLLTGQKAGGDEGVGEEQKEGGGGEESHSDRAVAAVGNGGNQLLLTDGVERRGNPNVLRVGDGIVRRIVSNDPKEHAREYRPIHPPPSHAGGGGEAAPPPPQRFPPPVYPPPHYPPYYPHPPPYGYPPHYPHAGVPYPPHSAAYPPYAPYGAPLPPHMPPPPTPPVPSAHAPPPAAPNPLIAPAPVAPPPATAPSPPSAAPPQPAPAPRPPGLNKFAVWPPPADSVH